jgi:hypothetical protein
VLPQAYALKVIPCKVIPCLDRANIVQHTRCSRAAAVTVSGVTQYPINALPTPTRMTLTHDLAAARTLPIHNTFIPSAPRSESTHSQNTHRTYAGVQNEGNDFILFCFPCRGNLSAPDEFTDEFR